jgi:MSHA biogenesis protein MshO
MATQKLKQQGFSLVELVLVIIVLGIVSVSVAGFIRTGMQIYINATERDQLLGESRFVVERLTRELRLAVPNSVRVKSSNSGAIQCLEFVPAQWIAFYTHLSVFPETSTLATIAELANNAQGYRYTPGDYAIVYPTSNADVYNLDNHKRKEITACTDDGDMGNGDCTTADDTEHTAELTVTGAFADDSPASRLYIARNALSYCVTGDGHIYRSENEINTSQSIYASGTLMAQNLKNNSSASNEKPFQVYDASLSRNNLVHLLLTFERNDEIINYSSEVHIPNVP